MSGNRKRDRQPNYALQRLRINAGLSPNQLAAEINVSAPTIRLAEKGHIPEPRVQYSLATYFDKEPTDIWPLTAQRSTVNR